VHDGFDELSPLAFELRYQRLGLEQVLEAVLGEVGKTRCDDAAQLQLHQQGFQRQLADVALIGQLVEHQLPLPPAPACSSSSSTQRIPSRSGVSP